MPFEKHFTQLIGVELPIIQAPMAGSSDAELAIAVSEAGGLGSLPCPMLNPDQVRSLKPAVVSFHFGLPPKQLLDRVRAAGSRIISSATTVEEAQWLEAEGCDAVIAQGLEAGGHRGMFLAKDVASQVGTLALTPQIVDAVKIPVIAAGGIGDARGIVAAFALGASAVQIGTAYLRCPESRTSAVHRRALEHAREDQTAVTNVITGRPARGIITRLIQELGPV